MEKPKALRRSPGKLGALVKSTLALTLVGGFLIVAAIEAAFLGILCVDVLNADRAASREFELLQGSAKISSMMLSAQKAFDAVDEARKDLTPAKLAAYHLRYDDTLAMANATVKEFEDLGLDTKGANRLRKSFIDLTTILEAVLDKAHAAGDPRTSFRLVLDASGGLYREFTVELKELHQALLSKEEKHLTVGDIEPQNLLYLAAAANIGMMLTLLVLVDRGITGPIGRLSKKCDGMMNGELLPKPKSIRNEVSSLEQSFFEMSQVVSENEKRRHNFLEFFQSVQSAALENVRVCFDTLLEENSLGDRAQRNISKARTNLNTLIQLLQSMTDALSFKAQSKIEAHYEKCTVSRLLSDASAAVEALIQKRSIKFQVQSEGDNCELDPNLIGRVLVNFLSNAIKYSPEGGEVVLKVEKQGADLRFSIKDQGPGIPPEDLDKLFKEFSQLNAVDGIKRSGTGLGLVICKQIVEAHGGIVGIESEVGKGSCFWFQIPKVPAAPSKTAINIQSSDNDQKAIKATKKGTLKRTFLLMMLLLLIPQSLVVLKLHAMFDNTSKRTTNFKNNKEVLLRVEELLSTNLVWKLDVANAIDARRIGDVAKTQPVMKEQLENCQWMLSTLSPKSETYQQIEVVQNGLKKLNKFGNYLATHEDNFNMAAMPELVKQARNLAKKVEAALFKAMALQHAGVQKSYDFSVVMRSELIAALGFAAVLNFGLLAITGLVALGITDRISKLKSKAEDFSSGKRLEPSLSGDDELTYLDKRLCEVSQAIKDADSQRQKLIAVINHDLRTPLSSIINGLQMILASGYGEIGEKEKAITTAAEQELEHLLQQINDLLLIEKIDAGLYQLSPEKFEVLPVLAATAKTFDETASQRGVKMVSEISPDCAELCVNGDKSLVEREFAIILSNAVKAAPDGSTIDFSVERAGDSIAVKFRDRGAGIDEELLPQIFDRFRFVNGKPVTGLGLPLAQRLSAIHGGSLQINSSSTGTETCVTLPLAI